MAGAAIGGAAGGILGAGISSGLGFLSQANQEDFIRQMYKKRYRWAVKDMRLAGLNPILAATQGIAGNIQGASPAQLGGVAGALASAGSEGARAYREQQIANAQEAKIQKETEVLDQTTAESVAREAFLYSQTAHQENLKRISNAQAIAAEAGIPQTMERLKFDLANPEIIRAGRMGELLESPVGTGLGAVREAERLWNRYFGDKDKKPKKPRYPRRR